MSAQDLAQVIDALAARRSWSMAEVHRRTGISQTTLHRIAHGRAARRDTLAKLDGLFGLPPGTLLGVVRGDVVAEGVTTGRPSLAPPPDEPDEDRPSGTADGPEVDDSPKAPIAPATIDFLSGNEDATAEQLLELLGAVSPRMESHQLGSLVEVVVTRALDELVEGTGWSVGAARADWGADLSLYDQDGNERVLVEVKSTPTQGFVPIDEIIGRAFRSRARMSKAWGRPIDFWVVFTTDPGPQVIAAFGDVDIPMGWVGHLPELPAGG
jgi:transcriptional regulator with XRE-family HTH domain